MSADSFRIELEELSPEQEAAIDAQVADVMAAYQDTWLRGWTCIEGGMEVAQ